MTENMNNEENVEKQNKDKFDAIITKADIYRFRNRKTWFAKKLKNKDEKLYANQLLRQYYKMFDTIRLSEFEMIKDIIYNEVLKFRIQGRIDDDQHNEWIYSASSVNALHKIQKRIEDLRKKLGIEDTPPKDK